MTVSSAVNWIDQAGTLSYTITRWNIHIVMQTSPKKKDKEYSDSFVRSTNQDFSFFPMANAWQWVVVFSSINLHSFSVMAAGVRPCLGDVTMASFLTGSTMIALKSTPKKKKKQIVDDVGCWHPYRRRNSNLIDGKHAVHRKIPHWLLNDLHLQYET